jgi:rhodanese-related sulfurtransferase
VVDDITAVGDIGPEEAHRLAGAGAYLLDVREDDEWEAGHAPGANHLAMGLVAARVDEIPTDRTVVCICRVGGRSAAVAEALVPSGIDARNMAGGMLAWEHAGLPVTTAGDQAGRII